MRCPPGRLEKKRTCSEELARAKHVVHCSPGNQGGHYKRTCKAELIRSIELYVGLEGDRLRFPVEVVLLLRSKKKMRALCRRFLLSRKNEGVRAFCNSYPPPEDFSGGGGGGGGRSSGRRSVETSDDNASEVERIYRILRKFHSRPPKLELALEESGVRLRPGLVERVLRRCGDAGAMGFRFFAWASGQPGGHHASADAYKALLRMLAKMREFGAAWALVEEMRRENPAFISPEIFITLMRRFAKARMAGKAIEVLDEMPKYGCHPDEHAFGCLLDALCKNGGAKEAAALFEDMRERFPPTLKHFTCLLNGWCRAGKLAEAKHVLVQMRQADLAPDVVVFNTLLAGHAAAGKIEDGYELLREMRRKDCEPNAVSYTTLIQALCSQGRPDEAVRLLAEMQRHDCAADAVTFTTLVGGFCKRGDLAKGYELLAAMSGHGCAADQATYLHILAAHEKKEQLEECLALLVEMGKAGCPPDPPIYTLVISLACKLGDLGSAEALWQEMENNPGGPGPGLDAFVAMVHGFLQQGSLTEACGYFREMAGRGLFRAPQYGTLKEVLNALLRAEKLDLAKDLWGCLAGGTCELNAAAWTIWVHALFSRGHVKEACAQCLDMMDAGLMPQPDTFARLMRGLKKLYNRQIAAEITDKVRAMAAERNITFKMYKRRGVRDLQEKAKAKAEGGRKRRARRRGWGPAVK